MHYVQRKLSPFGFAGRVAVLTSLSLAAVGLSTASAALGDLGTGPVERRETSDLRLGKGPEQRPGERRATSGGGMSEGGIAGASSCVDPTLTQSTAPNLIEPDNGLVCFGGDVSAETSLARSFVVPPQGFTLGCVTFGVDTNQGGAWPVQVRLLTGTITGPYSALTLIASTSVSIPNNTNLAFFVAEFPGGVALPGGSALIVELLTPSRVPGDGGDGGFIRLGCNDNGQSAATYLRADACGVPDFVTTASIGFPGSQVAMTLASAAASGDPCASSNHDCSTIGGSGCTDMNCCTTVCSLDPFCCDIAWDQACIGEAAVACALATLPCGLPVEHIKLRSGQVNGAPGAPGQQDSACTYWIKGNGCGNTAGPFTAAQFLAACQGPRAFVVPDTYCQWMSPLPCDTQARWINPFPPSPGNSDAVSALYCCPFVVATDCIQSAQLTFCWVVDDRLGDPSGNGPVQAGVFLGQIVSGVPVWTALPTINGGNSGSSCDTPPGSQTITTVPLGAGTLVQGINYLWVYQRDLGCDISGVMFSADIDICPCPPPCFEIAGVSAECKWWGGFYKVKFTVTNKSQAVAYSLALAPSSGSVAPNPVPVGGINGLAPGASDMVELTFCNAPISGSISASLLDAAGVAICNGTVPLNISSPPPCDGCDISCASATVNENEACWVNTVNAGCDVPPGTAPQFQQLSCGDTLCATTWGSATAYDTDWFIVDVLDPNGDGWAQLCLTLDSNVPLTCELYSGSCGTGLELLTTQSAPPCDPTSFCICVPAPSKYKLRIFPGCPPCGAALGDFCAPYLLTVNCNDVCPCVEPPSGMKAWWTFDETSGGIAHDSVCTNMTCGTDGAWINGPTAIAGVVDGALRFNVNGTNEKVSVGNSWLAAGALDLTVDAWIRWLPPDRFSSNANIIVDGEGYVFYVIPSIFGASLAFTHNSGGGGGCVSAPGTVPPGQWIHVAATLDQLTVNGYKLYINGQLVGQKTPLTGHGNILSAFGTVQIGEAFRGDIDEVELFYRALSQSEINSIYLAGGAGKCKERLKVPASANFCGPLVDMTLTMNLWNDSPVAQTYQLGFGASTSLSGCNGPPISGYTFTILPPATNPITVSGNACVPIKVKITAPPGLACGAASCYQMCATNTTTGEAICSDGKIGRSCLLWWMINTPWNGNATTCCPVSNFLELENLGDVDGVVPFKLTVLPSDPLGSTPPVSLNGLPPGVPATGTISAAPGQLGQAPVIAQFLEELPFETFDVLIEADTDNDGVLELMGVGSISYVPAAPPAPCPADLNGDGIVSSSDLGVLLGAWGTAGPTGDLNGDGIVGSPDLGILLGAWGACP
ncbi:MAG: LamG-like jellyroll fold domain-containing protein [Phycisphaerales bacterium]